MDSFLGTLNIHVLNQKMASRGIRSLSELSNLAGIHRNSLAPYLNGSRSIYASVFERICGALGAYPAELIKSEKVLDPYGLFPLLSTLWDDHQYIDLCCFLFGSRARGVSKKFSDYDIGISAGVSGVDSFKFLEIKEAILQIADDLPVFVDIVDFDNAPRSFLDEVDDDFILICGNSAVYQQLLGIVHGIKKGIEDGRCS